MFRILLIGAAGVFGGRLAELLSQEEGIHLVLAGRTRGTLDRLAAKISCPCDIAVVDRTLLTGDQLRSLQCNLVIDAAGPFDASKTAVIEAALDAGIHYIDLADGRAFVKNFTRFDAAARQQNIAMITGASSIPALSHAVIDDLTHGWQRIDTIKVGIFPGNRAPRGLAVVESILSYVGKPVQVFRNSSWQDIPGWGMMHRVPVPFVGRRWASVCDTPDQDLLVQRYRPTQSAEFFAGLELSVLHIGLWLMSWPVRWGWIKSLLPAAKPMLWMAQKLIHFGSDLGGMIVDVQGADATGTARRLQWSLEAKANHGPYVPVIAAAIMACTVRDGAMAFHGASPCAGMISLQKFKPYFERLGLATATCPAQLQ